MGLLVSAVLPLALIVGTVIAAQRRLQLRAESLATATFYLFAPALIFVSMAQSAVRPKDLPLIASVSLLYSIAVIVYVLLISKLHGLSDTQTRACLLTATIPNHGNFGLPLSLFAFGTQGIEVAVVIYVVSTVLTSTYGIYIASRGQFRHAAATVLKTPLLWAATLGFIANTLEIQLPNWSIRTLTLLADATIAAMLTTLGIQLASVRKPDHWRDIAVPVAWTALGRLAIAPALATLIATAVGAEGVLFGVIVLQAAMPSAVINTVLAQKFDLAPDLVSWTVVVTTVLSLATLPAWLHVVGV